METISTQTRRPGRRVYLLVTGFAVLLVLFPFLFWYSTWFGRRLTDAEIDRYLNDSGKPRHAQHALVQIGERISRRDGSATRWYAKAVELSGSPVLELRQTAAWIMGQDASYQPFHPALLTLLHDPQLMVRRNAALALSNFHDSAARPELIAMLHSTSITSPAAGVVKYRLKAGEFVNPGTLVARVGSAEIRAAVPGEVLTLGRPDGGSVRVGDPLAEVSADQNHVWEALRALYLVGESQDLDDVRRYARGVPGTADHVRQQAMLTMQAIQSRKK